MVIAVNIVCSMRLFSEEKIMRIVEERDLIINQLEIIAKDYEGMASYIRSRIVKTNHEFIYQLSPIELLDLYDSVLCQIYQ